MLVAARKLQCFGRWIEAGQPIPDPKKWHPVALASNINLGWVKDVPEEQVQSAPKEKSSHTKPAEDTLRCDCGKDFKSKRALSAHKSRSHR